MAIEPETPDDQAVEMAQQKVREIKRSRFGFGERGEYGCGREELVAMGARNAFNPFLAQHIVQQSARAAVAVGDEDRTITVARRVDQATNGAGNLFRPIMQFG